MAPVAAELVDHFGYSGPIGAAFPSIIRSGTVQSAANIDQSWVGVDASQLFEQAIGQPVSILNDADAAGVAEVGYGAARGVAGVVLTLTFGTGIGSGLFVDGTLVPNSELGHLEFRGYSDVEDWAAAKVRKRENLSWEEWAKRVDQFLEHVDFVFSPDLIVIGGGASKEWDNFGHLLGRYTRIVPALRRNNSGIIGAAMWADQH